VIDFFFTADYVWKKMNELAMDSWDKYRREELTTTLGKYQQLFSLEYPVTNDDRMMQVVNKLYPIILKVIDLKYDVSHKITLIEITKLLNRLRLRVSSMKTTTREWGDIFLLSEYLGYIYPAVYGNKRPKYGCQIFWDVDRYQICIV
jgi:hypothetical protein